MRNTSETWRVGRRREEGREGRDTRAASPLLSTHLWEGLAVAPSHDVQFFRHVQFFEQRRLIPRMNVVHARNSVGGQNQMLHHVLDESDQK